MKQMTFITHLEDSVMGTMEIEDLPNSTYLTDYDADRALRDEGFEPGALGICVTSLPELPEGTVLCGVEEAEYTCAFVPDTYTVSWFPGNGQPLTPIFAYAKFEQPKFDPQPESCWKYTAEDDDAFRLVQTPKGLWVLISDHGFKWADPANTRIGAFGGDEEDFVLVED